MLDPTLLCKKSNKVDNSSILQPKAILERRTLRLTKVTTTTTKPERETEPNKLKNKEGKLAKTEISGWKHFVKIKRARTSKQPPSLKLVARNNILISGFEVPRFTSRFNCIVRVERKS